MRSRFGSDIHKGLVSAVSQMTGHTHASTAAPAAPDIPDTKRQMEVAEAVMRQDHDLLRELAKR